MLILLLEENKMANKLLPIGSVVCLEGASKKLLIIGVSVQRNEDKKYDYIGVPFPEGYIDSNTMFLFYHKDIKAVCFVGYVNSEVQLLRAEYSKEFEPNM
ncbi:MAG: DUF4176 domain-containing protein [Clostridia bacterium]|nr:DUF4176 domain-containing protein [Clostridia bacterium]